VAPTVLTAISNAATIGRGVTSTITITFSEPVKSISAVQANPAGTLDNRQSADGDKGIVWTIDYTPPADPLHGPIELYMGDYEDLAGLAGAELANANGPNLTINYDCYATASVGEVPRATTLATTLNISVDCENMLIVDNSTLKTGAQTSSDGTDRFISHSDGIDYSFGDSDLNIFTGQVTDMDELFALDSDFNADIGYWDTSNVTNMFKIFRQASAFNQNISGWDTSNVTNMGQMFFKAVAFDQPIINWETGNVTNMSYMFGWLDTFNYDLNWDTSSVTNMVWMFGYAHAFNSDISDWNTSSVTNMNYMFKYAPVFDQDISGWDTSSNPTHFEMFVASPLAAKPDFQPSF
jgi:surface protein